MSSKNAPIVQEIGPHPRVEWNACDPSWVRVHAYYGQLLGAHGYPSKEHSVRRERYNQAKLHFNMEAAKEIVDEVVSTSTIDKIVDDWLRMETPESPIIILPHPEWDSDTNNSGRISATNALPPAYAAHLENVMGGRIDDEIIQITRPGRTKLRNFQRFTWQPKFEGVVNADTPYIIVDDVCHLGGTMAALRSYIVENGGTVVGASTLACSAGKDVPFPVRATTLEVLNADTGNELDKVWRKEIGHDTKCLTEPEADFLAKWRKSHPNGSRKSFPDRIREEISKTRAT